MFKNVKNVSRMSDFFIRERKIQLLLYVIVTCTSSKKSKAIVVKYDYFYVYKNER